MDLIKERNGFVYGCISLGVARGVARSGAARDAVTVSERLRLLGGWRALRHLLELRLGIRIRIRLSPLTLTASRARTRGTWSGGGECIRFLTLIV